MAVVVEEALCEGCHEPVNNSDEKGWVWAEVKNEESKVVGVVYFHAVHAPDWFPGAR